MPLKVVGGVKYHGVWPNGPVEPKSVVPAPDSVPMATESGARTGECSHPPDSRQAYECEIITCLSSV